MKINSFEGLANLKKDIEDKEPIKEGLRVTPEMLRSDMAQKFFKYFFNQYPEVIAKYSKKNPEKVKFLEDMKNIVEGSGNLSEQNVFYLNDLFIKFIKEIPINKESSNGVVFKKLAKDAGFSNGELDDAKEFLDAFIEPALKKFFGR